MRLLKLLTLVVPIVVSIIFTVIVTYAHAWTDSSAIAAGCMWVALVGYLTARHDYYTNI